LFEERKLKNFPDNLVITLDSNVADPNSYPFWLIGFDKKLNKELSALGVKLDASECLYDLQIAQYMMQETAKTKGYNSVLEFNKVFN
jgi:hypothetical protein